MKKTEVTPRELCQLKIFPSIGKEYKATRAQQFLNFMAQCGFGTIYCIKKKPLVFKPFSTEELSDELKKTLVDETK